VVSIVTMEFTTLMYYEDETLEKTIYTKYEINKECIIRNKNTKRPLSYHLVDGYYKVGVCDDTGKQKSLSVARAMLSTFVGPPPSPHHTADHIQSKNKTDNRLENLRWFDKSGQSTNRNMPETLNSAFIIVHDGEELTANEWAERTGFHPNTILYRAQNVRNTEWSYKKYDDLPGENWKYVKDSKNSKGWWKVSDLGRVAYHKDESTRKVSSPEELSMWSGYPSIKINGTPRLVHSVVFQTFRKKEYDAMKPDEMILHKNDDRMDCRIDKLRVGTESQNRRDAYDNGKYDGTKTARRPCVAHKGNESNPFKSITEAVEWLQDTTEYENASPGGISLCLNGKRKTAYGFTWTTS